MSTRQPEPGQCKSCGAAIWWTWTRDGKRMLELDAYDATDPAHQRRNRYTSHFATCPNAGQHRRAR